MNQPVKCIECYKNRPGGRCKSCPLHHENKNNYVPLENGYYMKKPEEANQYPDSDKADRPFRQSLNEDDQPPGTAL
ncbi:hypothetical protein [Effusibacillus consociatus]|uniref:Uncharacterized protein n=1 Tax=Effusibacillus consociatus TaxID=1117041 RepID=A0ABV9PZJ8_9BACL